MVKEDTQTCLTTAGASCGTSIANLIRTDGTTVPEQSCRAEVLNNACSTGPCHEVQVEPSDWHPVPQLQPQHVRNASNNRMPITLLIILNHCSVAVQRRHYNKWHGDILMLLHLQSPSPWPSSDSWPAWPALNCFPQNVANTGSRSVMMVWSEPDHPLWADHPVSVRNRSCRSEEEEKYADLLARSDYTNHAHQLVTLEVMSMQKLPNCLHPVLTPVLLPDIIQTVRMPHDGERHH